MNATHIGKTIIIWDKLNDHQISELLSVLKNIILVYRKNISILTQPISIPIPLKQNNNFISIIKKHNEILISMNKYKNNIDFSPILNGDILYESLEILKNPEYYIVSKIKTFSKYSKK